jgi:hypothetical protein
VKGILNTHAYEGTKLAIQTAGIKDIKKTKIVLCTQKSRTKYIYPEM